MIDRHPLICWSRRSATSASTRMSACRLTAVSSSGAKVATYAPVLRHAFNPVGQHSRARLSGMRLAMATTYLTHSLLLLVSVADCFTFPSYLCFRVSGRPRVQACRLCMKETPKDQADRLKQDGIAALLQGRTELANGSRGLLAPI